MDRRHRVVLRVAGRGVARGHPAHGHLGVAFALRTLHPHKLHVVVLVEAEGHPLRHLGRDADLQQATGRHDGGSSLKAALPLKAFEQANVCPGNRTSN